MKFLGLMVCRNEAWVLPATIPAAMQWLDGLLLMVHASSDQAPAIVVEASEQDRRVSAFTAVGTDWDEATYRGKLLDYGRALNGTHFAVIDADEMLTANMMPIVRAEADTLRPGEMLRLPWLQCWRSLTVYRSDASAFGRATVPMIFRDDPRLSYSPDGDGYQLHHRAPRGVRARSLGDRDRGGVLHFQHANWRRLCAKQALYQMQEVLRWPGRRDPRDIAAQYGGTVAETGLETTAIPAEWWPVDPKLIDVDAEPWQATEVERLIGIHGRERFEGLNFFGF